MSAIAEHWVENPFKQSISFLPWRKPHDEGFKVLQRPKVKSPVKAAMPVGLRKVCGIEIPNSLSHIADAIEKSEYILTLPDDWDDEGSPHYERETWERAAKFVLRSAISLWERDYVKSAAPSIHNGPAGSIDIHWKTPMKELLINVPPDREQSATYYGMNKTTRVDTKGSLDVSEPNEWLLTWIIAK